MPNNIDRRDLLRTTVAGAAALGTGCPLTFDKDGQKVEWWCIIDVVDRIPNAWLYLWKNCRTGKTIEEWDHPNLSTGDCSKPDKSGQSCARGAVISQYDSIVIRGRKMLISPKLSAETRDQITQLMRRKD